LETYHGVTYGERLIVVEGSLDLTDPKDVKALILEIQALGKFGVIFIDTMAQATPGANENTSEDMGRMLAHCKEVGHYTGALVCLVSHSGKDLSKGTRGWSGLRGAMDFQLEVQQDPTTKERSVRLDKSKDGADGTTWPFTLEVVDLGRDKDGRPITSCVVVPVTSALSDAAKLAEIRHALLKEVKDCNRRQIALSHVSTARNYVVKHLGIAPTHRGTYHEVLMDLIDSGALVPDTFLFKDSQRHAKRGLTLGTTTKVSQVSPAGSPMAEEEGVNELE
jgi:hypothetical protein